MCSVCPSVFECAHASQCNQPTPTHESYRIVVAGKQQKCGAQCAGCYLKHNPREPRKAKCAPDVESPRVDRVGRRRLKQLVVVALARMGIWEGGEVEVGWKFGIGMIMRCHQRAVVWSRLYSVRPAQNHTGVRFVVGPNPALWLCWLSHDFHIKRRKHTWCLFVCVYVCSQLASACSAAYKTHHKSNNVKPTIPPLYEICHCRMSVRVSQTQIAHVLSLLVSFRLQCVHEMMDTQKIANELISVMLNLY